MRSYNSYILAPVAALALFSTQAVQADILFQFTEVGGDVTMTSSGTLNTANLLPSIFSGSWGGTGVENNTDVGDIDIMGGTFFGDVDIFFMFNPGTIASSITNPGGPFSSSNFAWTINSGSKSFTTYSGFDGPLRVPGIGMKSADIVGGLWTPDQNWTEYGDTFASLGLNFGTYSVSDLVTGETITIQIGGASSVPDGGSTVALFGMAIGGLAMLRRKF